MTIQIGSKGDEVIMLQTFLGITADGVFGQDTENAVKKWQLENRLTPDGIVGPNTLNEMGYAKASSTSNMKTSQRGINMIQKFEGCSLVAYYDPGTGAEPITIGYGNTTYENGDKIKICDKVTLEQANTLLLNLLPHYESILKNNITVDLNQNQFDALISFVWNTGGSKTLFSLINSKSAINDIYEFWTTNYIKGGGKILQGLVSRRKEEADLFCNTD